MDSISLGLISEMRPPYIIPSNIIKGEVLPLIVVCPRTPIEGSSPAELVCPICNPATVPCKDCIMLVFGESFITFKSALTTEPVKSDFFMVP